MPVDHEFECTGRQTGHAPGQPGHHNPLDIRVARLPVK